MNDKPHLDEEALAELRDVMEDEFAVLIRTFLNDSRERIQALKLAFEQQDARAFCRAAHSFKGSSINIGAPRLGALCLAAEETGREGRLQQAGLQLQQIEDEFREVGIMLDRLAGN